MKIVLLGKNGQVGSNILKKNKDYLFNLFSFSRRELDISNLSTIITAKYNSINEGQKELGSLDEIKKTFTDFQKYLYKKTS